jgi:hypothetical protein
LYLKQCRTNHEDGCCCVNQYHFLADFFFNDGVIVLNSSTIVLGAFVNVRVAEYVFETRGFRLDEDVMSMVVLLLQWQPRVHCRREPSAGMPMDLHASTCLGTISPRPTPSGLSFGQFSYIKKRKYVEELR